MIKFNIWQRLRDAALTSTVDATSKRYVITNPPFDFGLLPTDQVRLCIVTIEKATTEKLKTQCRGNKINKIDPNKTMGNSIQSVKHIYRKVHKSNPNDYYQHKSFEKVLIKAKSEMKIPFKPFTRFIWTFLYLEFTKTCEEKRIYSISHKMLHTPYRIL